MLKLREARYPFDGENGRTNKEGGKKRKKKKKGWKKRKYHISEEDHNMNFLCYTARGIMIVTREEMFVLYIS